MANEYYSRVFLNPEQWKHSIAAVYGMISDETEDKYPDLCAEITISDCNRNITLDFSVFGRCDDEMLDDIDQYRDKAKILRDEVNNFIDTLLEVYDTAEKNLFAKIQEEKAIKEVKNESNY